jgi:uncharacterized membrane protein HdeD (DUF308 family)
MATMQLDDSGSTEMARSGMPWWLFLVTGILWLLVSLVVLRFDITSVATVGVLIGLVLLFAGLNEVVAALAVPSWKWVHWLLAILLIVGSVWAFVHPIGAFWELAAILGFLLMLKGSVDIVISVITKPVNELWWLGLVVGILEVLLAFWVSQQYFGPRAAIIIIWVGFAAMLRGISEIVLAFRLRRIERDVFA